jgi:hypothetical protein
MPTEIDRHAKSFELEYFGIFGMDMPIFGISYHVAFLGILKYSRIFFPMPTQVKNFSFQINVTFVLMNSLE